MNLIRPFLRSAHDRPHAPKPHADLDEDAFHLWCHGGYSDNCGRLRALHPGADDTAIAVSLERAHRLYDAVVTAPLAAVPRDASAEQIHAVLEREVPGLSARAYRGAAEAMICYFMTYDSWM